MESPAAPPDEDAPPLLRDRRFLGLLILGAALRALVGLHLWLVDPLARHLVSDAAVYREWAVRIAQGDGWPGDRAYWLPPAYPWLLSWGERAGLGLGSVLALQALAGLLTTALLVRLADRVIDRRAALAAGLLWTLYAPVLLFEQRLLAVNAAVLPGLVALLLAVGVERGLASGARPRALLIRAAGVGIAAGLAALARPNLLIAAPALALAWLAVAGRARVPLARALVPAAACCLALAATLSPALLHNHGATGAWMPITANGGLNFWFGNNPAARGTFFAPGPEWGAIDSQRAVSHELAAADLGEEVGDAEASRYWLGRGRAWIAGDPAAAARLTAVKLGDSLSSTEYGIQVVPAAVREIAPSLWLAPLPLGLLLALAALGARGSARGRASLFAWLLAGLAAMLLVFTYSRFRLPLLPALLPFAGRGLVRAIDALRGAGGLRPAAIAVAAALLLQSLVPWENLLDGRSLLERNDLAARQHAHALVDAGRAELALAGAEELQGQALLERVARAEQLYGRALVRHARHVEALLELASLQLTVHRDERAARDLLERARRVGGDDAVVLHEWARLLLGARDPYLRDPAAAIVELRAWVRASDRSHELDARLRVLLAAALLENPAFAERTTEWRALVDEVLVRHPDDAGARLLLERAGG
jgi:hypothetical protein